jgi:hypothetical protein
MVPARLHGVDWVGDPYASVPCATPALADLARLFDRAGVPVHRAQVGYHDAIAAIMDITLDHNFDEILLCERKRPLPNHPFDLAHRARRVTALPVVAMALPDATPQVLAQVWRRFRQGHCSLTARQRATANWTTVARKVATPSTASKLSAFEDRPLVGPGRAAVRAAADQVRAV